ncbi:hypothetical protein [Prochlorococcus marinus]|uniref:hypothetical protein n=1 Tax=Prochlorococcus marinus TaxID=1219 RepID=UPI0022B5D325|nr:hypothetical protein [Prochlorococcus marinus]
MKPVLFFLGSAIRWMGKNPSRFLFFHLYISLIYVITYIAKSNSLDLYRFIFIAGAIAPLLIAIYRGLPLDCLDLQTAIKRELSEKESLDT